MKAVNAKQEPGERGKFILPLIFGTVGGFVVCILALCLIAVIYTSRDFQQSAAVPLSCIAYGIGALFGGFLTAKKLGTRGLASGALTGLIFFVALYIIGAVMHMLGNGGLAFIKLFLSLLCGAVGGIIGVNNSHKRIRRD